MIQESGIIGMDDIDDEVEDIHGIGDEDEMEEKMRVVTIADASGNQHTVEMDAAVQQSDFIRDACGVAEITHMDCGVMHMERIPTEDMLKIVEFMRYHRGKPRLEIPVPLNSPSFESLNVGEWYVNFITAAGMGIRQKISLASAARFMGMDDLANLAAAAASIDVMVTDNYALCRNLGTPCMPTEQQVEKVRYMFGMDEPRFHVFPLYNLPPIPPADQFAAFSSSPPPTSTGRFGGKKNSSA